MNAFGNFFIKNKCWELEIRREKLYWKWFEFQTRLTRRTDHAGFRFYIEILGFIFDLDIYDHRHWDDEKNSFEECECDKK